MPAIQRVVLAPAVGLAWLSLVAFTVPHIGFFRAAGAFYRVASRFPRCRLSHPQAVCDHLRVVPGDGFHR